MYINDLLSFLPWLCVDVPYAFYMDIQHKCMHASFSLFHYLFLSWSLAARSVLHPVNNPETMSLRPLLKGKMRGRSKRQTKYSSQLALVYIHMCHSKHMCEFRPLRCTVQRPCTERRRRRHFGWFMCYETSGWLGKLSSVIPTWKYIFQNGKSV